MSVGLERAPLAGLTVLEVGGGLAGRFAGTLLADLGADVRVVEDVGDRSPDPQARRAYDRNKQSVTLGAIGGTRLDGLHELVRRSDIVLVDRGSASDDAALPLDEASLREAGPEIVYCLLSGFGDAVTTPTPRPTDRTVEAWSGCMDLTGHEGKAPFAMGLPLADLGAGVYAAIGVLGVVATADPHARSVEVARHDVAVCLLSYMAVGYFADGEVPTRVGTGHSTIFPYNAFRAADGEVVVAPFTNRFWRNFCEGIGRDDLLEEEELSHFAGRLHNKQRLIAELEPVLATRTVEEWVETFREYDVPSGPVLDVADALALAQTTERGMIRRMESDEGPTRTVGSPFTFRFGDGVDYRPPVAPPSSAGDDTADVLASPVPAGADVGASDGAGRPRRPLEGVGVLDLTRMFAGPCATEVFADLGAEVIKLEEPRVGDPTRRNLPFYGEESAYFLSLSRGKKSVAVDLKSETDRDAVAALAADADVVLENYRPGVMDRLGLSYDELARRNPAIVFCSLSGFGASGPLRDKISFDLVNQAMSGTIDLTGDPDDRPVRIGVPIGDMAGGLFAAIATLAALRTARRTGRGCWIDLALHDVLISLLGRDAQRHLDTGEDLTRIGNRDRDTAPVGAYRTTDGWLVVDAGDDDAWYALVEALGATELAADGRFGSAAGRKGAEDEIDAVLAEHLAGRPAAQWESVLTTAGVPVARVRSLAEALDSDLAAERGLAYEVDNPGAGRIRNLASPLVIDGHRAGQGGVSPRLGEHTVEVLGEDGGAQDPQDTGEKEGTAWTYA